MKAFIKKFRKMLADPSGFTLLELIIAAALIVIIASAFASATVGNTKANMQSRKTQYNREISVGHVDQELYSATPGYKSGDTVSVKITGPGLSGTPADCDVIRDTGNSADLFGGFVRQ